MKTKVIQDNRILHMHGVAEYMYENAEQHGFNSDEMYLFGLVHDIGYMYGENHEENGGILLRSLGFPKELCEAVICHGMTPQEYTSSRQCFESEIPEVLVFLWEADMHIDLNGENVGYEKRLEDIGTRHGKESQAYKNCHETISWLMNREAIRFLSEN